MRILQLNTWYKIEDYIIFKNLVYEYFKDLYAVDDYDEDDDDDYNSDYNADDIIHSKPFRCVEHICEEQRIKYIKILALDINSIRYTTKIPDCEGYIAITDSDCEEDTNSNCEEKENKMVEKKQGAFTLLENYYNEKLNKINEESLAEKSKVIENSDVYKQYKPFKEFIDKRAKEIKDLYIASSGISFDIVLYLSPNDKSALKEIANYTQKQKDDLRKECGTINALLEMTDDYDKQIDILTRYGVITLPKKRK